MGTNIQHGGLTNAERAVRSAFVDEDALYSKLEGMELRVSLACEEHLYVRARLEKEFGDSLPRKGMSGRYWKYVGSNGFCHIYREKRPAKGRPPNQWRLPASSRWIIRNATKVLNEQRGAPSFLSSGDWEPGEEL